MANTISIEVELDDDGAIKALNGLEKESKRKGKKIADSIEEPIDGALSVLTKSINPVTSGLAAAAAAAVVFSKGISAAVIQEQAVERLNQQLKLSGEFTAASSRELQEYASSLQLISEFGDEALINQIALAKSFGATNEQAKLVASTAIDVSKSFGISLESATRNVSKTLGGYAGELGEVIPELKNFTTEQLQAGAGIDLIAQKFDGAGKNLTNYGFVTQQASNAFGDLLEEVGKFATENEFFIQSIKDSIKFTNDFAAGLGGLRIALGIEKTPTDELGKLDKQIALNIDKVNLLRETLSDTQGGLFGTGFLTAGDKRDLEVLPARIEKLDSLIENQLSKRKELVSQLDNQRKKDLDSDNAATAKKISNQELIAAAAISSESLITASINKRIEAVNQLAERELISEQEKAFALVEIERQKQEQLAQIESVRAQQQIETNESITDAVALAAKSQQASFVELGKTLTQVSIQGFGNAFRNIGKALAEGGNAAQAFTDTVKGTIGDLANAFGDFYIAKGVALSADPSLPGSGAGLIAAGAALKVLSGFLGGSATGGAGGGAVQTESVGSTSFESDPIAIAEPEQERPVTNQITVQGDVFDSEETGLRIFDIISQQSEKNGNVIIGGAFA